MGVFIGCLLLSVLVREWMPILIPISLVGWVVGIIGAGIQGWRELSEDPLHRIGMSPIEQRSWVRLVGDAAGVDLSEEEKEGTTPQGWTVRLTEAGRDQYEVRCDTGGAVARVLTLGPEGFLESADLQLDDREFDRAFRIGGPRRVAVAMLRRTVREQLLRLREKAGVTVQDGVITAQFALRGRGPDVAGWVIRDVVTVGEALAMTALENPARLAGVILDAEEPITLRQAATVELFQRWPKGPEARSVEATLTESGDSRLLATLDTIRGRQRGQAGGLSIAQGDEGALSEVAGVAGSVSEAT